MIFTPAESPSPLHLKMAFTTGPVAAGAVTPDPAAQLGGPETDTASETSPNPAHNLKQSQLAIECQCHLINFTLPSEARVTELYHCHCLECRAQSSSAFGTSAIVAARHVFPFPDEVAKNVVLYERPIERKMKNGDSDDAEEKVVVGTLQCFFCRRCGSRLVHRRKPRDRDHNVASAAMVSRMAKKRLALSRPACCVGSIGNNGKGEAKPQCIFGPSAPSYRSLAAP